jgi:hypothetical protein
MIIYMVRFHPSYDRFGHRPDVVYGVWEDKEQAEIQLGIIKRMPGIRHSDTVSFSSWETKDGMR